MNERELGEKVAEKYGQTFERTVEGPARFGRYRASRVWTYDENREFHAHYVIQRGDKLEIFEDFLPFANWLADEFSLTDRIDHAERYTRIAVATCVVLVALGLLVYLIVWQPQQSQEIKYLLSAVVGAAASYIFLSRPSKKPSEP